MRLKIISSLYIYSLSTANIINVSSSSPLHDEFEHSKLTESLVKETKLDYSLFKRNLQKIQRKKGEEKTSHIGKKKVRKLQNCTFTQQILASFSNTQCIDSTLSVTANPSSLPSKLPTPIPSIPQTQKPSHSPSQSPTDSPSQFPTRSINPSINPSFHPTSSPSTQPSKLPTRSPSTSPTNIPSNEPSPEPSKYPSRLPSLSPTENPTLIPSSIPSKLPSLIPTVIPTLMPTSKPSSMPSSGPSLSPSSMPSLSPSSEPTNAPSTVPSMTSFPSSSPSLFPQNTCFFSERSDFSSCKDHIISNSTDNERILNVDEYICAPNKRYKFGMTLDKFLCLCDGNEKIWCADNCCQSRRDPFVKLNENGCLTAYRDRLIGNKRLWASDPSLIGDDNEENNGFFADKPTRKLQVTDDGNLVIVDFISQSDIIWQADLDSYVPYHPPTPGPTLSISPSSNPTKSPAPTISTLPSSSPVEETSQPSNVATFNAGELVDNFMLGMRLSQGLSARLIGRTGSRVRFADGSLSFSRVHDQPDAGGCFDQPNGGWIYVSNAEVVETGGVGAFKFNRNGGLENYKMVQTGTNMNCGGGKTPWGTWFTGEEWSNGLQGGVWEVDVRGGGSRMTNFGRGKFESAICDDRDMTRLSCFATLDSEDESLRKYTPNTLVLENAVSTGDYSRVMHSAGGQLTYLLLNPTLKTFSWTLNKSKADSVARKIYPNAEGIDHHDGILYFVSKVKQELFTLDLDKRTYQVSSTRSGSFKAQPDQIAHIIGDDPNGSAFLYFLEDGGNEPGVFARNLSNDQSFTILEKIPDEFDGDEATGLAFCDNYKRMIFAFQERGTIYEVTRDDGKPFYGATANVKYHQVNDSRKRNKQNIRASMSMDHKKNKKGEK